MKDRILWAIAGVMFAIGCTCSFASVFYRLGIELPTAVVLGALIAICILLVLLDKAKGGE